MAAAINIKQVAADCRPLLLPFLVHNIEHNYIRLHVCGWPNFFTHPHRSKELLGFTEEALKSAGKAGYEGAVVSRTNS